ncbi:SH3 domain-containing protein [Streptomyces tardus]|nr:SH3 domain-containing protein [Streptomyces tardus]
MRRAVLILSAVALPLAGTATAASALPPVPDSTGAAAASPLDRCDRPGPWIVDATAVKIRSRASTKSTSVGIIYRAHKFKVHKSAKGWHYITNGSTGVKGWVSGVYVYRNHPTCF